MAGRNTIGMTTLSPLPGVEACDLAGRNTNFWVFDRLSKGVEACDLAGRNTLSILRSLVFLGVEACDLAGRNTDGGPKNIIRAGVEACDLAGSPLGSIKVWGTASLFLVLFCTNHSNNFRPPYLSQTETVVVSNIRRRSDPKNGFGFIEQLS